MQCDIFKCQQLLGLGDRYSVYEAQKQTKAGGTVLWLCVPFRLMVQKGQKERSCFSCGFASSVPLFSYSKTSSFISTLSSRLRHLHSTLCSLPFGTPLLVLVRFLTVRMLMASFFYPAAWQFNDVTKTDGNIPSLRPPASSRAGSTSLPWPACQAQLWLRGSTRPYGSMRVTPLFLLC